MLLWIWFSIIHYVYMIYTLYIISTENIRILTQIWLTLVSVGFAVHHSRYRLNSIKLKKMFCTQRWNPQWVYLAPRIHLKCRKCKTIPTWSVFVLQSPLNFYTCLNFYWFYRDFQIIFWHELTLFQRCRFLSLSLSFYLSNFMSLLFFPTP